MRVELQDEPVDFDRRVRQPGLSIICELVGESPLPGQPSRDPVKTFPSRRDIPGRRFWDYWKRARQDLLDAYGHTCAFSGRRVVDATTSGGHSVNQYRLTIDHMVPKSTDWELVYEWTNLRLACRVINERKADSTSILDPCMIDAASEEWFHMRPLDGRLRANPALEDSVQQSIEATIDKLDLNSENWRETRRFHYDKFRDREDLSELEGLFPFVAREIRRLRKVSARPRTTRNRSAPSGSTHTEDIDHA